MKNKDPNRFDPADVEFSAQLPPMLENEKINNAIDWLVRQAVPLMDHLAGPLAKFLNTLGRGVLRLMGLKPLKGKVIRLPEYKLRMHDGAICPTDIFLPEEVYKKKTKAPTILVRLPYWKNMVALLGYLFASEGYVCVLSDIRGCASAIPYGTMAFTFFIRQDGLTTIKWISERFWFNGKLGMWGLSFLGVTQLAISWDNGNLVTCLNPGQSSYTSVLFHPEGLTPLGMSTSILRLVLGITQNIDPAVTAMMSGAEGISKELYFNPLLSIYNDPIDTKRYLLDLKNLAQIHDPDQLTKLLNETYNINLKFNQRDNGSLQKFLIEAVLGRRLNMQYDYLPYAFGFTGEQFQTPMLFISAWYDMFWEPTLRDLKKIQENSPQFFKKNFKIVIGPGSHGGMNMIENRGVIPKLPNGKELFSLFQNFAPMWWYDHWLKGDGHDLANVPTIRLYVMQKGLWRNFNKWPPNSKSWALYLHSNGNANSLEGDGKLLETVSDASPPDEYDFDPSNPVVTRGGRFLMLRSGGLNQVSIEKRKDILIYTSEKLKNGLEIIGEVKLILYASSSAKDTDFCVKLVDVHNNRKAINVIDDAIRVRFRDGLETPSLIDPGKIYKYEIYVGSTAWYFKKNHRIRIEVTSSNFPKFNVNSNLAGDSNETGFIIAHQKIFHTSQYSSALILPLFEKSKTK